MQSFATLRNKTTFSGRLILETALHIGTSRTELYTDGPMVKNFDGLPFIPGSSLKGVLRSAVERLSGSLGIESCGLFNGNPDSNCMSVNRDEEENFRTWLDENSPSDQEQFEQLQERPLCDTCKLFGSTYIASRLTIPDLPIIQPYPNDYIEIRDGVGIRRDTGTAADGVKYDYEVTPTGTEFSFSLTVENLDSEAPEDWNILAAGLLEMMHGHLRLGGNTSRGLGQCRLALERIEEVDFANKAKVLHYLEHGKPVDTDITTGKATRKFLLDKIRLTNGE